MSEADHPKHALPNDDCASYDLREKQVNRGRVSTVEGATAFPVKYSLATLPQHSNSVSIEPALVTNRLLEVSPISRCEVDDELTGTKDFHKTAYRDSEHRTSPASASANEVSDKQTSDHASTNAPISIKMSHTSFRSSENRLYEYPTSELNLASFRNSSAASPPERDSKAGSSENSSIAASKGEDYSVEAVATDYGRMNFQCASPKHAIEKTSVSSNLDQEARRRNGEFNVSRDTCASRNGSTSGITAGDKRRSPSPSKSCLVEKELTVTSSESHGETPALSLVSRRIRDWESNIRLETHTVKQGNKRKEQGLTKRERANIEGAASNVYPRESNQRISAALHLFQKRNCNSQGNAFKSMYRETETTGIDPPDSNIDTAATTAGLEMKSPKHLVEKITQSDLKTFSSSSIGLPGLLLANATPMLSSPPTPDAKTGGKFRSELEAEQYSSSESTPSSSFQLELPEFRFSDDTAVPSSNSRPRQHSISSDHESETEVHLDKHSVGELYALDVHDEDIHRNSNNDEPPSMAPKTTALAAFATTDLEATAIGKTISSIAHPITAAAPSVPTCSEFALNENDKSAGIQEAQVGREYSLMPPIIASATTQIQESCDESEDAYADYEDSVDTTNSLQRPGSSAYYGQSNSSLRTFHIYDYTCALAGDKTARDLLNTSSSSDEIAYTPASVIDAEARAWLNNFSSSERTDNGTPASATVSEARAWQNSSSTSCQSDAFESATEGEAETRSWAKNFSELLDRDRRQNSLNEVSASTSKEHDDASEHAQYAGSKGRCAESQTTASSMRSSDGTSISGRKDCDKERAHSVASEGKAADLQMTDGFERSGHENWKPGKRDDGKEHAHRVKGEDSSSDLQETSGSTQSEDGNSALRERNNEYAPSTESQDRAKDSQPTDKSKLSGDGNLTPQELICSITNPASALNESRYQDFQLTASTMDSGGWNSIPRGNHNRDAYAYKAEREDKDTDLQPTDNSVFPEEGNSFTVNIPVVDTPAVDLGARDTFTTVAITDTREETSFDREKATDARQQRFGIDEERDETKRKHGAPVNFARIYDDSNDTSRPCTLTSLDVRPSSLTFDELDDAETTSESCQTEITNEAVECNDLSATATSHSALVLALDSNISIGEQASRSGASQISDPEYIKSRQTTDGTDQIRELDSTEVLGGARRISSESAAAKKLSLGAKIQRASQDHERSDSVKRKLRHDSSASMSDAMSGSRFAEKRSSLTKVSFAAENQGTAIDDRKATGTSKSAGNRLILKVRSTYQRLHPKENVSSIDRNKGSDEEASQKSSDAGTKLSRLISFRTSERQPQSEKGKRGSGHGTISIRRLFSVHRHEDSSDNGTARRRFTDESIARRE